MVMVVSGEMMLFTKKAAGPFVISMVSLPHCALILWIV